MLHGLLVGMFMPRLVGHAPLKCALEVQIMIYTPPIAGLERSGIKEMEAWRK